MSLRVLYATAELYPFVKTGGLADVAAGLPPALAEADIDIRYFMPGYPQILDEMTHVKTIFEFQDFFGLPRARLLCGQLKKNSIKIYVLDAPEFFDRPNPYISAPSTDWPDNHLRFGSLCYAAASVHALDPQWQPEIIHGHDWHFGLTGAYLAGKDAALPAFAFTIHNIAYQGIFPASHLHALKLDPAGFNADGFEYYNQISFMKAGIQYADAMTTVSPTYAEEITTPEYGCGLDPLLSKRRANLHGIINGIDRQAWSPETDELLPFVYTKKTLDIKRKNKRRLLQEMGLDADDNSPVAGIVSRLTPQKGLDLVQEKAEDIIADGWRLILLGTGDADAERSWKDLARRHPDKIATCLEYKEPLAHRIIGGADVVLLPSRFEPCGLVQLYGLKYGTLPIVRRTGGLADTVKDNETGFVFDGTDTQSLYSALKTAAITYQDKKKWRLMQERAMQEDWSWQISALKYWQVYESIRRPQSLAM